MIVFATPADWAAQPGNTLPTDPVDLGALERRLESASRKVRRLTKTARYHHDVLGTPLDAGVAGALRDATLAQLDYTAETDPTGFGLPLEAVTVGPVQLAGLPAAGSAGGVSPYAPAALEILVDEGLISSRVGYR